MEDREDTDRMRDPDVRQVVESPANTMSEKADCHEGYEACQMPAQERRMNRSMTMGPTVFRMQMTSVRKLGGRR